MKLSDIASPDMFRERMSGAEAHHMLTSKISAVSYLGDIAIYDVAGDLINWLDQMVRYQEGHRGGAP